MRSNGVKKSYPSFRRFSGSSFRTLAFSIALLSLFLGSSATAPAVDLPQTGQTGCFDASGTVIACPGTGQDGEIRSGTAWPSPRFALTYCDAEGPCTDQGADCDGNPATDVVTDSLTELMWARDSSAADRAGWPAALSLANELALCGYADWRLPNVNELESLVHADAADSAAELNLQGFVNVQPNGFWSSSAYFLMPSSAWFVHLGVGLVFASSQSDSLALLPVRGATSPPAEVWKTGQTASFGAGDDGDLQTGADWPSPRFTFTYCDADGPCADPGIDCDGNPSTDVVRDALSGRMWTRDAGLAGGPRSWSAALEFANGLQLCGFTDWVLPDRKTFHSLSDFSQIGPALGLNHPFVGVGLFDGYWTSTTYGFDRSYAWIVGMGDGNIGACPKNDTFSVWPSRPATENKIPLPAGQQLFIYPPTAVPMERADPSQARPLGVGSCAADGDTVSLRVALARCAGPVDLYIVLFVPELDADHIYLITPGGIQPVTQGLVPWKAQVSEALDERLLGDLQALQLPFGTYFLGLLMTPAMDLTHSYGWVTHFSIP